MCSINDHFVTINISQEMQNSNSTLKNQSSIAIKNAIKNHIRWQLKMHYIKQSTTINTLCQMVIYLC